METKRIQISPAQVELSAPTGASTMKGIYADLPYNKGALNKLYTILGQTVGDKNLFDDQELVPTTITELQHILTQVIIRFDNDPSYYTKKDYQCLIGYLCKNLIHLISQDDIISESVTSMTTDLSELSDRVQKLEDALDGGNIQELLTEILETKQDKLTTGDGITINDNVIANVWTEEDLIPSINIGGLTTSDTISKGDSIVDILKRILTKAIGLIKTNPSFNSSGQILSTEYGSNTLPTNITFTFTQGKYTSTETSSWNKTFNMNCKVEKYQVKAGDEVIKEWTDCTFSNNKCTIEIPSFTLNAPTKVTVIFKVSANTAEYKDNQGNVDTSIAYNGGDISVSVGQITPYHYFFMGSVTKGTALTSDIIRKFPHKQPVTSNKYTYGGAMAVKAGDIIIACPVEYVLTNIEQTQTGGSYLDRFNEEDPVDINCGTITKSYRIYKFSSITDFSFKNITFTKKQ